MASNSDASSLMLCEAGVQTSRTATRRARSQTLTRSPVSRSSMRTDASRRSSPTPARSSRSRSPATLRSDTSARRNAK